MATLIYPQYSMCSDLLRISRCGDGIAVEAGSGQGLTILSYSKGSLHCSWLPSDCWEVYP